MSKTSKMAACNPDDRVAAMATPSDTRNVTGGQGVAGSNPAVSTGSRAFSNIVTPHKSQQKSHLVVQWPFQRRAPMGCRGVLPGHAPRRQNRPSRQSRSQRSLSRPESARRPRQRRTGRGHHRPHRLTASRSLTALQQLQDAGQARAPKPTLPAPPWTRRPFRAMSRTARRAFSRVRGAALVPPAGRLLARPMRRCGQR
jgi:hypothetical protein